MPALPGITDFTDAAVTEGQFKTAFTTLHSYLSTLLGSAGTQAAALAALGALGAGYSLKTSAYTITTADRGKTIAGDSTFELTLPNVATAGAGWSVIVTNVGSGVITVAGARDINGESSLILGRYDSAIVTSTGSEWLAVGSLGAKSDREVLTSGSGSVTVPGWANAAFVSGRGGGGGGGGRYISGFTSTDGLAQDGGSGGACFRKLVTGFTPGDSLAYSIGGGGAAGGNDATPNGGAGGATTFAGVLTLGGGSGGLGTRTSSGGRRASSGAGDDGGAIFGSNGGLGYFSLNSAASPRNATSGGSGILIVEWARV